MKQLIITFIVLSIALAVAKPTYALNISEFPLCANPQGDLKVEYTDGLHAIPGDPNIKSGSDKVYWVGGGNALQCLCEENGQGIQTNWLKAGDLTQDEINSLTKQGWNFVPSGSAWGLESGVYLAKNSTYSCSSNGGGGTITSTAASTDNGIGGAVLGLATTGGNSSLFGLISLGVAVAIFGARIRSSQ